MHAAGEEILDYYEALAKGGTNLVLDFLRGTGTFEAEKHYPEGTVTDGIASFYYHAHRDAEHGHFHTFLLTPDAGGPHQPYVHVVGIKLDDTGIPQGLFTTNRWVTGETIQPAKAVIAMLDQFTIAHAWPSYLVNRWMTAMFVLFRPTIETLLVARDKALAKRTTELPLEDRELEITSERAISIDRQIAAVDRALR